MENRLERFSTAAAGARMQTRLAKLEDFLRVWMGYFWISEYYRPIPVLDPWIRRRVRMCF